jgi:superoxide oxidase
MGLYSTETQWSSLAKALHWLIFLLILAALVAVNLAQTHESGSDERLWWMVWHLSFGVTAMILMVGWLVARRRIGRPLAYGARWQLRLSAVVHWAMVVLVIAMPLAGLLMAQFSGYPVMFYHLVPIPPLLPTNEALAEQILAVHTGVGAPLFALLILVHIIGSLWHQLVNKDRTLKRMLPGIR